MSGFFERLFGAGTDVRALGRLRTAAIGPATAERLKSFGLSSDIVPENYRAESVVAAFRKEEVHGKQILLPRAQEARQILPAELAAMGAVVREVAAYKTLPAAAGDLDALVRRLEAKAIDLVTFTSSSTVKNFKALLPPDRFQELAAGVPAACIGPVTADTARQLGFDVAHCRRGIHDPGAVHRYSRPLPQPPRHTPMTRRRPLNSRGNYIRSGFITPSDTRWSAEADCMPLEMLIRRRRTALSNRPAPCPRA